MIDAKKLGQVLRARRKERNLTQMEAAEILGIAERTLRNIEQGKTVTDLDTLSRMTDLYDMVHLDFKDIYTRDPDMAYIMGIYHIITALDTIPQDHED